jgi:hypothetical protein
MSRTLSESGIVRALAGQVSQRLTRKVISYLQSRNGTLLSAEDSIPLNTWDEICVQVQYEQSLVWDAYDETVRSFLQAYVDELPHHEQDALWLQTPQGDDWNYKDADKRELYPVCGHEIVDYLLHEYVYAEAGRWTNARIRAFIDRLAACD